MIQRIPDDAERVVFSRDRATKQIKQVVRRTKTLVFIEGWSQGFRKVNGCQVGRGYDNAWIHPVTAESEAEVQASFLLARVEGLRDAARNAGARFVSRAIAACNNEQMSTNPLHTQDTIDKLEQLIAVWSDG